MLALVGRPIGGIASFRRPLPTCYFQSLKGSTELPQSTRLAWPLIRQLQTAGRQFQLRIEEE
jgi:hypothetical protein